MGRRQGETAEEYLERIPEFAKQKSSLGKAREFLGLLGNPDRDFQIFHVAGTNGKGSVCAFLSAVFGEAGIPFGAFTSPHLVRVQERFSVNGVMVGQAAFEAAFETVCEAVRRWMEAGNPHPTYFEFLFYMGLVIFREAKARVLILETGMGGLKDVTNVVERPLVSVITSISLDHTAYLGNTLEEIAAQKAGILKPGCPAVCDASCREAALVFERRARELGIQAELVERPRWEAQGDGIAAYIPYQGSLRRFAISFPAPYQAQNAALAVRALEHSGLGLPAETVLSGIPKAAWPARMERLSDGIYLDGAHNEGGIRSFLEAACLVREKIRPKRTVLLFGVSSDKNYHAMLEEIGGRLAPEVCLLAQAESKRALPADRLCEEAKRVLPRASIRYFGTVRGALEELMRLRGPSDLTFIVGSLYLAGEIKREFSHD